MEASKRQIIYWPGKNRLVYIGEKADSGFWDRHWRVEGHPLELGKKSEIVVVTKKFLPKASMILEGGCGRANKAKALFDSGYNVIGIDFADATIMQAKKDYPMLDLRQGDVRSLGFPDSFFDGYWSLGVVEHFWSGYDNILSEAARVIKSGGFLFLSTPWFSPYRRWKVKRGKYPETNFLEEPELFYQFALSRVEIEAALELHGFKLIWWRGRSAKYSMLEDMKLLKCQIRWLFESRGSLPKRVLRRLVLQILNPFCGHTYLAIARRNPDKKCYQSKKTHHIK